MIKKVDSVLLKKVKDKKKLPPGVEHKVLTKEEIKKKKKYWTDVAAGRIKLQTKLRKGGK